MRLHKNLRKTAFWFKNEKELMHSLGMKGTPGSGNGVIKEDGQNEHLIAQLKSTDGSSLVIKLEDVTSLLYHATVSHKLPIFINQFFNGPILVSVRLEDLKEIAEYMETGVRNGERFQAIAEIVSTQSTHAKPVVVKTGGREVVRAKMQKVKEAEYKRRELERKAKK